MTTSSTSSSHPNAVERSITEQFSFWQAAPIPAPLSGPERAVFVGCGTSYYLAQSLAAAFNVQGRPALAVAGNEWASHQAAYVTPGESLKVVAVSRSGESTETLLALQAAQAQGLHVVGLTCAPGSTLDRKADTVILSQTHPDEGIVMTASASLMLLGGLRLAGLTVDDAEIQQAQTLLEQHQDVFDALLSDRTHVVFLGAGELYGVAQEAALKLQEMSLTVTQAYHPLEYRHGPISLVDGRSLMVLLYHPETADDEARLAADLRRLGATVIGLGGPGDLSIALPDLPAGQAARRGLSILPLLQWLGERVAQHKGLDSSTPRHLTKVVTLS